MDDKNMLDLIGNTPLVRLERQKSNHLYGKLELMNPFGMKDRVAKNIILKAKAMGFLKQGAPIIESSSGTMACGLALVGSYLGHPVHIVTDPRIDPITLAKLESLGCEVHVVEKMGDKGWQSSRLELLNKLLQGLPGAFWPRQYDNYDNPTSYYSLADELIDEIHQVDYFVAAVGSGGSISGTAEQLKRINPKTRIIAVDCVGSVIFGQPDHPGRLQSGLGNSLIAKNVKYSLIDEVHWLSDEEAFNATLELAKNEKIFAGNSSGSVYKVGQHISKLHPDKNVVVLMPDRGDRYATTIYNPQYWKEHHLRTLQEINPQRIDNIQPVEKWTYMDLSQINNLEDLEVMKC